ncbi:MAG: ABC transporter permease [Chloroflexi bacterium]|nr:ABC transporter permease [Chloroflexota bacterium]
MRRVRRLVPLQRLRELSLVLILIIVIVIFGNQIDNYYTPRTFNRISSTVALITLVAVGQTLVLLTRNVDLSVGSMVGFTAYYLGRHLSKTEDMSPMVLAAMAMGIGGAMGLINGLLVAYGRIPAIVVTLGTMAIYRGALVRYSDSKSVATRELPPWIKDLPQETLYKFGEYELRALPGIALGAVIIFFFILLYSSFGRRLYAIGSSPEAAHLAGIHAPRMVTLAFTLCGALSGLGGMVYLARFGTITVEAGRGLELQVVAAAVVGGVSITGGSGTVLGAMLGAILIGTLEQSLIRMQINEFWKDAVMGLCIIVAVSVDRILINQLTPWWSRTELQRMPEEPHAEV